MSDVTLVWDPSAGRGDWVQIGAMLATGNDLQSAVIISLFTDRVAAPGDVIPDGSTNPRGWWGDLGSLYPIGSRLWLLDRSPQTQDVLNKCQEYCAEALQWMIDDGVAASVDVNAYFPQAEMLGAVITITQPDGPPVTMNFQWAWNQLN